MLINWCCRRFWQTSKDVVWGTRECHVTWTSWRSRRLPRCLNFSWRTSLQWTKSAPYLGNFYISGGLAITTISRTWRILSTLNMSVISYEFDNFILYLFKYEFWFLNANTVLKLCCIFMYMFTQETVRSLIYGEQERMLFYRCPQSMDHFIYGNHITRSIKCLPALKNVFSLQCISYHKVFIFL